MKVSQPLTFTKGPDMNSFLPSHLTGPTPMQQLQEMHEAQMAAHARTQALLAQVLGLLSQKPAAASTTPAPSERE
jgi:hypothetical protein